MRVMRQGRGGYDLIPSVPSQGLTDRVTWPSSVAPCALPFCAAVAGQVRDLQQFTAPTRTASTTRV